MPAVGIAPVALQQFSDVDGNPLAGGKLFTYMSGTTTPLATYTDATGMTQNPNPLILDSGGFASPGLFLQALAYTFALTDANNIPQWSQDGIISDTAIAQVKRPFADIFTGSGTWTIPVDVIGAKATLIGGGGGGGGGTGSNNGGGGGAGSSAIAYLDALIPGETITVTIGGAGTGVSGATGADGGATSISSGTLTIPTVTTVGGHGGFSTAATSAGGAASAMGTGGAINTGGSGGVLGTGGVGGSGAGSFFGGGGAGAGVGGINGNPATGWGSGGGGGSAGSSNLGGNGFGGIVVFEYLQ